MQQRAQPKSAPPPATVKKGTTAAAPATTAPSPDTTATANDKDKSVRTVGPTFIPPKQ